MNEILGTTCAVSAILALIYFLTKNKASIKEKQNLLTQNKKILDNILSNLIAKLSFPNKDEELTKILSSGKKIDHVILNYLFNQEIKYNILIDIKDAYNEYKLLSHQLLSDYNKLSNSAQDFDLYIADKYSIVLQKVSIMASEPHMVNKLNAHELYILSQYIEDLKPHWDFSQYNEKLFISSAHSRRTNNDSCNLPSNDHPIPNIIKPLLFNLSDDVKRKIQEANHNGDLEERMLQDMNKTYSGQRFTLKQICSNYKDILTSGALNKITIPVCGFYLSGGTKRLIDNIEQQYQNYQVIPPLGNDKISILTNICKYELNSCIKTRKKIDQYSEQIDQLSTIEYGLLGASVIALAGFFYMYSKDMINEYIV